jgi:tagatose 1,6-diphosphate aldolase
MAAGDSKTKSATLLTSFGLTPGKLRGLQRISNPNGTLTMLALDQNSSMIEMAHKALKASGHDREPTFAEITEAKVDMAREMSGVASALLIDGYYGAFSVVASGAIAPEKGLLIRVEKSGSPKNSVGAPLGEIEPGWSVQKIKYMGADAVKLLAPFEPDEPNSAEHQLQFVRHIYEECQKYDILMLLEPVAFPFGGEKKTDEAYRRRKAHTVLESARQLSRWCDVYKAEFPGDLEFDDDARLRDNLQALTEASVTPWVLLSAGVDYPQYKKQVELAVECGCSGVLGGRAFWKEYFTQGDAAARTKFAATEGRGRVAEIDQIVRASATPWWDKFGLNKEAMSEIRAAEGWHARYLAGFGTSSSGGGHVVRPGEVY